MMSLRDSMCAATFFIWLRNRECRGLACSAFERPVVLLRESMRFPIVCSVCVFAHVFSSCLHACAARLLPSRLNVVFLFGFVVPLQRRASASHEAMVSVALWAPFTALLRRHCSRALLSCAGIAVAVHAGNIPAALVFALAFAGVHAPSLHACRMASFWAAYCCCLSMSPWFRVAAALIFLRFPIFGDVDDTIGEVDYGGDPENAPGDGGFISPPAPDEPRPAVVFWNWPEHAEWSEQTIVPQGGADLKCMWLKVEVHDSKGNGILLCIVLHDARLDEPVPTRFLRGQAHSTAMSCAVIDGSLSSDRKAPTLLSRLPLKESFRPLLSAAHQAGKVLLTLWKNRKRHRENREAVDSVQNTLRSLDPVTVFDLGSLPLLNLASLLASPERSSAIMRSLQHMPDVSLWCTEPPTVRFDALKPGLGRDDQTTQSAVHILSAYLKTSFWAKLCCGVSSKPRLARFLPGSAKAQTDSLFFEQTASQLKNTMLFVLPAAALQEVLGSEHGDAKELATKIWNAGRMVRVCATTMSEARIAPKCPAVRTDAPSTKTVPYVVLELLDCHEFVFAYMVLKRTAPWLV